MAIDTVPAKTATPALDMASAMKEAAFAAMIMLGLCIPLVAYGTRQNINNELVLDPRWDAVGWAVAIIFVGRFLISLPG